MSQDFEAIYENGVLRPLQPVGFREHEVVSVHVVSSPEGATTMDAVNAQRNLLLRFISRMETLDEELPPDDVSNRDHDRILYGERD
jgi:predicted DNA-binding antitoxin AbrB/MazE fold protein